MGATRWLAQRKKPLAKNEYAWAVELINYIYKLDPNDVEVRQVKAAALRKLGQLSDGSIGRAFLLSEARALEGKEQIPRNVPPPPAVIAASPATFVNYYRVRIDPKKAETTDRVLAFQFRDQKVGAHVRRGVAEYVPDFATYYRKPDLTVSLDGETFAKLYLNTIDLAGAVSSNGAKVTEGSPPEVAALLDLFDKFEPARNVTIPRGAVEH